VVNVSGLEAGGTWQYSLNGGSSWNTGSGNSFNMADNTTYAAGVIQVRQTDVAGNPSGVGSNAAQWREDSTIATAERALVRLATSSAPTARH
jgi:hypothetical protein